MSKSKPLYSQIVDDIKAQILSGQLVPGDQLSTEFELAQKYGVSRITSQRALVELERAGFIYRKQGKGSFVLPLENKVVQGISHKVISMILPSDGAAGRRIDYIRGANDCLKDKGYYLNIYTTNNDIAQERRALLELPRNGISGIIHYPIARANFDVLYDLYLHSYPIVLIDKYFQSLPACSVVSDNFDGGYKATSCLIEMGHKRIAYLTNLYIEDISTVRERFFGYCKALKDHGLPINNDIIHFALDYNGDAFAPQTIELLKSLIVKNVTAIFAEHDYLAMAIYRELGNMDIKIPEDISLMGFDNVEILESLDIPLATVDQNFYEIGRTAAGRVVDMIEQGSYESSQTVIPVEVITRNSIGPAKF